jgi:metal-responsive CopG/Arc/MetJ family transcriptional regulator
VKVAISVPDRVFEEAERVAKRLRVSRSRIYSLALEEFVGKHRRPAVRESLEAVYGEASPPIDPVLTDLQAKALREKW